MDNSITLKAIDFVPTCNAPRPIKLKLDHIYLKGLGFGDPEAKPVLALHGWLDNAASFVPLAAHLDDCYLVALDLAGHGQSQHRPPGYHYHFIDYMGDVVGAADALGWQQFRLLGHSLGGAIAVCAAAVMGERVSKLGLIESTGPYSAPADDAPDRWRRAQQQLDRVLRRRAPNYTDLSKVQSARIAASPMTPEAARLIVERSMQAVPGGWTWSSDARLKVNSPMYLTEEHVRAYVSAVTAPTLLIRGTDSAFKTKPNLVARQALFQHLKVVDMPGKHHLHMDYPQAVAAALNTFFDNG